MNFKRNLLGIGATFLFFFPLAQAIAGDGTASSYIPQNINSNPVRPNPVTPLALPTPFRTGDGSTVFTNPAQYSTTQQAQVYERANEVNAAQVIYIQSNLDTINSVILPRLEPYNQDQEIPDPDNDNVERSSTVNAIHAETNEYCNLKTDKPKVSEYTECLQEFRMARIEQLRELQENIQQNQNSLAHLQTNQKGLGRFDKPTGQRNPAINAKVDSKLFPKIPSYLDLTNVAQARALAPRNLSQPVLDSVRKAGVEYFVKKALEPPKEKDFPATHLIYADPDDATGSTLRVTNTDGIRSRDFAAFSVAKVEYQNMMSKLGMGNGSTANYKVIHDRMVERLTTAITTQNSKKATALAERRNVLRAQAGDISIAAGGGQEAHADDYKTKDPQTCDALQKNGGPRFNYCVARSILTEYFNGEDPDSKSKAAQRNRSVAGGQSFSNRNAKAPKDMVSEAYELNPEVKNPDIAPRAPGAREEEHSLYMDPSYIDDVMKSNDDANNK